MLYKDIHSNALAVKNIRMLDYVERTMNGDMSWQDLHEYLSMEQKS